MRNSVFAGVLLAVLPVVGYGQPYSPPPSDFTAYWEEPAFKTSPYAGADKAKGVILWSHGVSGKNQQWHVPPPEVIRDFARDGWDVVKIQRNNLHEAGWSASGTRHVSHLVQRIAKARTDGYRHVIAAGQSYGGAISLEASARTDQLFGVMAFGPGHGSDACGPNAGFSSARISDNLQRILTDAIEAAKAPRINVVMADGDECQGFNEPSALIRAALRKTSASFVHLDATMPVRGHGVAATEQFRRWYGPCLIRFFDPGKAPDAGETQCPSPSPAPRFLLANPKGPDPDAAPGKPMGLWSGTYASATSSSDFNREICVAVEQDQGGTLRAQIAFGAGPEKKSSMLTMQRNFQQDGTSFVYKGNNAYRMALTPDAAMDAIALTIVSGDSKITWTGTLKRGC